MARTYGIPAEYSLKKASDKTTRMLLGVIVLTFALGFTAGSSVSGAGFRIGILSASCIAALVITAVVTAWVQRRALQWEEERQQFRKGARGEAVVADILSQLSDKFFVLHNLPTAYADYDHLVIGPTGIFAIETKDWRGLVTDDGLGELVVNGSPRSKPVIRHFIAHVMQLRNHVCETTGLEHYFQPVFVFTSAMLKVAPGTTKNACCLSDDELFDCIENAKPRKPFPHSEAARIAKCLYDFALMNGKAPHQPPARTSDVPATNTVAA